MEQNPFAPAFDALPETIPVFPLEGVLLLPTGTLPLNIFEKRYLKMVEDALAGSRLIGMIQPKGNSASLYDIGCAGKITEFEETPDGRYQITLTGICRFKITKELEVKTPYRQVLADWGGFHQDLATPVCLDIDRGKLTALLQSYFSAQEMNCDWAALKQAPDNRLMTCLSMVCPFEPEEKQALLEAPCCRERAKMFMSMLEMAVKARQGCKSCH